MTCVHAHSARRSVNCILPSRCASRCTSRLWRRRQHQYMVGSISILAAPAAPAAPEHQSTRSSTLLKWMPAWSVFETRAPHCTAPPLAAPALAPALRNCNQPRWHCGSDSDRQLLCTAYNSSGSDINNPHPHPAHHPPRPPAVSCCTLYPALAPAPALHCTGAPRCTAPARRDMIELPSPRHSTRTHSRSGGRD